MRNNIKLLLEFKYLPRPFSSSKNIVILSHKRKEKTNKQAAWQGLLITELYC